MLTLLHAQEKEQVEKIGDQHQTPITFYVGDHVILHGEDFISYQNLVRVSTVKKQASKKPVKTKKKLYDPKSLKKPAPKKAVAAKPPNKSQLVFPVNFTSGNGESAFVQGRWGRVSALSPSVNNYTFNAQSVLTAPLSCIHTGVLEIGLQKYGRCLSYLQRRQFKNSFRRGPPAFI